MSSKDKPFIIGITGGSGSGKTSFLKALRQHFSKEELCIVSQDDYYKPRAEQYVDEAGIENFDLPSSIDHEAFEQDIHRLIAGEVVQRSQYVFNNDLASSVMLSFVPTPVLVLEGLFVHYIESIKELIDLDIFLHAKENLKVIRRIKRDRVERNYPLDDVLYRYEHHVLPTFEKYIRPLMDEADIVINNNEGFDKGLEVVEAFIQLKLH